MTLPTWSVIAMVDEPAPLVAAFAQHMRAMGAADVALFLDRPNPEAVALLADVPGVRVTTLDDAYWAQTPAGVRPDTNVHRQMVVAGIVARQAPAEWLLHCDCDEFLRSPDRMLAAIAAQPPEVTHVSMRMAERVHLGAPKGLFGGIFRRMQMNYDSLGPQLHGDMADLFHRGLSGHMMGKTLTRMGAGMVPTVHFAVPEDTEGYALGKPGPYLPHLRMLHFDGLTPLHYAVKIMRRVLDPASTVPRPMAPQRSAQIARIRDLTSDPAALARFVVRMTMLTPRQEELLRAAGALDKRRFRPQVSDSLAPLLTPAAFDRRLRERHAPMLRQHAPALMDDGAWQALLAAALSAEDEVGRGEL